MDPVTILLFVGVFLFLVIFFKKQNKDVNKKFPPGPRPLPIVGNILQIDMSKPYRSFVELSKEYGTVFSVQLGMSKIVVLCGLETIKDALINHVDDFVDRPKARVFSKSIKDHGIILANGHNWKVMRRFTLSTLRDYGMGKKSIENKIMEEADALVQKFRSYKGKPFENLKCVNSAVANIIVAILLNQRFDYEDPTILKLVSLINENIRLFGTPLVRLFNSIPLLIHWMPGAHNKIMANIREFHSFLKTTFTKQRKELDVNDQRNLIDSFLVKQQEGTPESTEYFHDENLIALVDNLFVAGMETTSTTLRWGLLLMMKYPEIQEKVHNEIEAVIGSAQPQIEHRTKMPYTNAVIHEVQRFGDIAPSSVSHVASHDVTFRGYFLPKGTIVMPLLHSVLKGKAYFEKPEEFYPEHFLDSDGNFKKSEAFIPFSIGKRSCAGETLAKMELFIFFTTLLQNFTFQAPPGAKLDLIPGVGSTNAPKPYEICALLRR
ncbi:cytochrome P450 2K1-like isoform 1-T1 [Anomaloglossus baeobatrachus]|uniref:cytochrome P450 2K1-like isoform X1 n=1 Tax=Anomaloglossus baeobatrachus TaxID=238106 RepID=UPI003F504644